MALSREGRNSVLSHYHFFLKSQYWDKNRLREYQLSKLKIIIEHAYNSTAYYRELFDRNGIQPKAIQDFDDLQKIPILTRDVIFANQNNLISQAIDKSRIQTVMTGGTTGQQATICRDIESANLKMGSAYRFESFMGRKPSDKMAIFWPAHIDFMHKRSFKEMIKSRYILGDVAFYTGNYDVELFQKYFAELKDINPEFIKAFPSALNIFTDFLVDKHLRPMAIKGILTSGEVLNDIQRNRFENFYQCPVYNLYSSREAGNSASECAMHSGLHIAMETTIVEFAEGMSRVPEGKIGYILITDLTNFAMPLIRYRIDDSGAGLAESCTCGRNLDLMSPVVGRLTDDFYSPDGRRHSGNTLGYYITTNQDFPIGQIQIIQETLLDFKVRITDKPTPNKRILDFIKAQMHEIIGNEINIDIEIVKELPREKSGKLRFVKCNYKPGN